MSDPVNHPTHYTQGAIETIDAITSVVVGYDAVSAYMLGNVVKYIARAPFKGNAHEDLRKARWYFERALEGLGVASAAPEPAEQVHELAEYMRCHETFKRLIHATEHECKRVSYSVHELWVSGILDQTWFKVKYLPSGKWDFDRILNGEFEESTHTTDEIIELFERWAKKTDVSKEEVER